MGIFGSHVSAAGGLDQAVQRAKNVGCECLQVFTKNNNQWAAKPLDPKGIERWREALESSGLTHPIAHASYLINLASPEASLRRKSVDGLVMELERADQLGLEGLVFHPGAHTTAAEADGLARVVESMKEVLQRVPPGSARLLIENTAGQGTCLGHTLEQLSEIFDGVDRPERVGICIDTCHAFAAGYPIHTARGWKEFKARFRGSFPADALRALHLNDSKKGLGSRVDRHEHIGRGAIELDGFRRIVHDPWLRKVPGYLETEKGIDEESGEDWDVINLRALRSL